MADDAKGPSEKEEKPKVQEEPKVDEAKPEKLETKTDKEPLQAPEKLKDKSPEDIAKMYVELEKKMGEQSSEIGQARETQDKMNIVLQAVWSDPELYRKVETAVQKQMGKSVDPIADKQLPKRDAIPDPKEAGKKTDAQATDQRRYLENQIISGFQNKFGVSKLPPKERQELMQKVSTAWAEMLDPKGAKTKQDLLASVELDVLPQQLENAYWLTQKESLVEKGNLPNQDLASIGSMPSGSGKSEAGGGMTPQEQKVAEKLGVSPEKYAKRKQQIRSEFTKE